MANIHEFARENDVNGLQKLIDDGGNSDQIGSESLNSLDGMV